MKENKIKSYLLYSIGEIVLVVVGILVAVQIDNLNEARKERKKEVHYLTNIRADLVSNLGIIDHFLEEWGQCINSAQIVVEHIEGKPITDWDTFNRHCINVWNWERFYQTNNTFEELTYSGNLAIISNDSIKSQLLNLDAMLQRLIAEEDHFRFDSEEIIYPPLYELIDMHPLIQNYMGKDVTFTMDMYVEYFSDTRVKNGFLMAILEFSTMNSQLRERKEITHNLIEIIDKEITR
ncbi:DUF6090 family protein [Ekhidna sp.]|uniref:DUF6090 family protein n=1 Tax=Ekhidna sp. TaxID=2608089 RepID=UPI003B5A23DF